MATWTIGERNEFLPVSEGLILHQSQTVAILSLSHAIHITTSASVEIVGEYYFSRCEWICEADFANGAPLRKTAGCAFCRCASLQSISIPASAAVLSGFSFSGCSSLVAVVFKPDSSWKEFRSSAFSDCNALMPLLITRTVQVIDEYAFEESGMKSLIL
jgi:hypothetical protein